MKAKVKSQHARPSLAEQEAAAPHLSAPPISYWSYSSLMAFLRNPLAWHKRYVQHVYDTPTPPSAVIGRAAHVALQHYYGGLTKEAGIALGLEHLRSIADVEIQFGRAVSRTAQRKKRASMEQEYLQAISFYLAHPPKHDVRGIEVAHVAHVPGLDLPIKAISDLVVRSKVDSTALDIVDHKFVDSFSAYKKDKTLFVIQAIFNYYTVRDLYGKPVRRFLVYECRKRKNADGSPQMRKYIINFADCAEEFAVFHRLLHEATVEITRARHYLPNPSDVFEGEHSFMLYRLGL